MNAADSPSQEKLDQMLTDGKITEEDYLRLSRAMASGEPATDAAGFVAASEPARRFLKDWERGLIGGLCAGCARYWGHDPWVARAVVLTVFLLLTVWSGIGLALALTYFLLCAFLPWDQPEPARAFLLAGRPKAFLATAMGLWFVAPAIFGMIVVPKIIPLYDDMGLETWAAAFHNSLPGRALDAAHEYVYWTRLGDFRLLFFLLAMAVTAVMLDMVYRSLCRAAARRWFLRIILGGGALWLAFLVLGTFYPLVKMFMRIS